MPLAIPEIINKTGVAEEPVDYEWDDDNVRGHWAHPVRPLEHKIGLLSVRARVLIIAGINEWAAWRLSKLTEDKSLFECLESAYASVSDWKHFKSPKKSIKWRKGPILGPLDVAQYLLIETHDRVISEEYVADMAVYSRNLVEHIMPKHKKSFEKWLNSAIERLQKISPFDPEKPLGKAIPRQVIFAEA